MLDKTVLLRQKGSKESQPFEAGHAKRLLDYPNTQWEEVADKAAPSSKPATAAPARPKTPAAAAKVTAAAAAPALPEVDTTSQPTSI